MSTKPTAQDYERVIADFMAVPAQSGIDFEVRIVLERLRIRAAELASQRQEPEADEVERIAQGPVSSRRYGAWIRMALPIVRAYASSLRSKA